MVTLAANEALSGEFTVTYPDVGSTEPLAHDVSAEAFASAIRALDPDDIGVAGVTVSRARTGVRGYAWTVTFDDLGAGDRPQLVATADASLETRTTSGTLSLEVETLTDGVAGIGGTFEISFDGDATEESTGPLAAHNVSAREVEAAIEALSGAGDVTVQVELLDGGDGGRVFTVTWPVGRSNVPALRVNGSALTPTVGDVGGVVLEAAVAYVNEVGGVCWRYHGMSFGESRYRWWLPPCTRANHDNRKAPLVTLSVSCVLPLSRSIDLQKDSFFL